MSCFPDYGLVEIDKFRDYICSKRKKEPTAPSFDYAIKFLLESVTIIPGPLYRDKLSIASTLMEEIDPKDEETICNLLHNHCRCTASQRAKRIMDEGNDGLKKFVKIIPIEYKRILESVKTEEKLDLLELSD